MNSKVAEIVTEKMIEMIENGVAPWRKPWTVYEVNGIQAPAFRWNGKPYRGMNSFLLGHLPYEIPVYLTFNQAKAAGGTVKKGEKSHIVVFWKMLESEELTANGKKKIIRMLRYYRVFNVSQCEGLPEDKMPAPVKVCHHNPIQEAEAVVKGFVNAPKIGFANAAYYTPSTDVVMVPSLDRFPVAGEYYSTLFHELTHSTGHKDRLNRPEVAGAVSFGSGSYGKEELVAEMGAAMLCGSCGIADTIENSASCLASWLKVIKAQPSILLEAAGKAQKAFDLITGTTPEAYEAE
jgi:antirestriction protein ArdC